jgi:hypothetical protein
MIVKLGEETFTHPSYYPQLWSGIVLSEWI